MLRISKFPHHLLVGEAARGRFLSALCSSFSHQTVSSLNSNCKTQKFECCSGEFTALPRPIGVEAVSTLDSTAQPQPFSGHAQKDLQFLCTFGIPNMINILEHHGMLESDSRPCKWCTSPWGRRRRISKAARQ